MIIPTPFCLSTAATQPCASSIIKEHLAYYEKILERYHKTVTKNQRLCRLAQPKCVAEPRLMASSNCEKNQNVNIIDLSSTVGTRTEQLAYPSVRKLTDLRECPAYRRYCRKRKENVNCMLRKSFLSLYSRLSNMAPPYKEAKVHKFTPEELKTQKKSVKRLSRPYRRTKHAKRSPTDDSPVPKRAPDLERIKELAQPRVCKKEPKPEEWHLKADLKNFKPSDRLNKLSAPVKHVSIYDPRMSRAVGTANMDYYNYLSTPKRINRKEENKPFFRSVSKNAQRAVASARVLQLALPRDFYDMHIRKSPFEVRRPALHAKATQRILELAKPRKHLRI